MNPIKFCKRLYEAIRDRKDWHVFTIHIGTGEIITNFARAQEVVSQLACAMRVCLDKITIKSRPGEMGAKNYVEFVMADPKSKDDEQYVLTLRRKDGLTPDEMRRSVELDLDYERHCGRRRENEHKKTLSTLDKQGTKLRAEIVLLKESLARFPNGVTEEFFLAEHAKDVAELAERTKQINSLLKEVANRKAITEQLREELKVALGKLAITPGSDMGSES